MIETWTTYLFGVFAVVGAVLMIVLQHPMRVAMALIFVMISLGGIYGLIGLHVIAVFQIMIYVSAVMVFMVYAIMLLDVRDASFKERYSRMLWPGVIAAVVLAGVLLDAATGSFSVRPASQAFGFGVQAFSKAFLDDYWLYFELSSVLLVVAVLAAVAVVRIRSERRG